MFCIMFSDSGRQQRQAVVSEAEQAVAAAQRSMIDARLSQLETQRVKRQVCPDLPVNFVQTCVLICRVELLFLFAAITHVSFLSPL